MLIEFSTKIIWSWDLFLMGSLLINVSNFLGFMVQFRYFIWPWLNFGNCSLYRKLIIYPHFLLFLNINFSNTVWWRCFEFLPILLFCFPLISDFVIWILSLCPFVILAQVYLSCWFTLGSSSWFYWFFVEFFLFPLSWFQTWVWLFPAFCSSLVLLLLFLLLFVFELLYLLSSC